MTRKNLPIPTFFDKKKAGEVWKVQYEERAKQAEEYAKQNNVEHFSKDKTKICLMPIDAQNTFCIPYF